MNKLALLFIIICINIAACASFAQSLPYDYSSTRVIPIKLSITETISTRQPHNDGEELKFRVLESVYDNGELVLKQGDIVSAKLETFVKRGMNGFPAELLIDDFEIPGIRPSQIKGDYTKKGVNLCWLVFPLKWALTPLPPSGSLTNFIIGTNVALKPKNVVIIHYYPDWK